MQAEASRFVAIKVDATNDDAESQRLQEKYKVVGLPTVVVLDSTGQERVRFNEFVPPDKMAEAISSVD